VPTLRLEDDPFAPRYEEEAREIREESDEVFDRLAFASLALERLRPRAGVVALCAARSKLRVDTGHAWGKGARAEWAVLYVPPRASRRAITLAVAGLARTPLDPYELDVLMAT
jgi:hypothetical protein